MKILPAKTKKTIGISGKGTGHASAVAELEPNSSNLTSEPSAADIQASNPASSMEEYDNLKLRLLLTTLALAGIIFGLVWWFYGHITALNYLLGACVGVVYLRMLAKSVDRLGNQTMRLGYSRLAVFVGLMIIASRWEDLRVLPVFLGFLTYKAAILIYMAQELADS